MTELEALNMLLRLIGSRPVNNLSSNHPDAANARDTLDRVRKKAQRRGWWFNIDYGTVYQPDSNGFVEVPKEISSVVPCNGNYTRRGNRMYDKYNNTYTFTENVDIHRSIRLVEWEDMPGCFQEHCADLAAIDFIRDELEDPSKQAELKESAGISALAVKKQDLEETQYNMFDKTRVVQARAGVQPYQRNNKRFYGDPDV